MILTSTRVFAVFVSALLIIVSISLHLFQSRSLDFKDFDFDKYIAYFKVWVDKRKFVLIIIIAVHACLPKTNFITDEIVPTQREDWAGESLISHQLNCIYVRIAACTVCNKGHSGSAVYWLLAQ